MKQLNQLRILIYAIPKQGWWACELTVHSGQDESCIST